MKTVFEFKDYKAYLKDVLKTKTPKWGSISRMAEAAGCQRAYLSRVLNSEVHITPDHAFGIAAFLRLSEAESDFFLLLVDQERASSAAYRVRVNEKISRMRREHDDLQKRVNRPSVAHELKEFTYYSSWLFSALHIIVSIPELQTTAAIARRLQLPEAVVLDGLKQLEEWSFVVQQRDKWKFGSSEIHIPKNSPLVALHHANWRQRAVLDAQNWRSNGIHFSVVQSIDASAWDEIRRRVIDLIEEASRIAGPSKSEKLVCFTTDFFEV
ncbi:MAG TPA: TIGR02147 family protein [Bdellovibrionales bacterium]|jgi:uncharacterized protein (TIGR02147 family)|nr:TIGR02147 family protein [Bdellovibrionales bacterium]